MLKPRILAAIAIATAVLSPVNSPAQERQDFGPFYVLAAEPDRLYLDGALPLDSAQLFWTLLGNRPETRLIVLNSDLGTPAEALVIADIVRDARLDTLVPAGAECSSSCELIFFAGIGRRAEGGVTIAQFGGTTPDIAAIAPVVNGMMEASLLRHGGEAIAAIFRASAYDAPHRISAEENAALGIDRSPAAGADVVGPAITPPAPVYPDFNGTFVPAGDEQPVLLTLSRPDGQLEANIHGSVQWSLLSDPNLPTVLADVTLDGLDLRISLLFYRSIGPLMGYVSETILVDFIGPPGGPERRMLLSGLGVGPVLSQVSVPYLLLNSTVENSTARSYYRSGLLLPRVFEQADHELFFAAETFTVLFERADNGQRGRLQIAIGDGGHAALQAALAPPA